MQSAARSFFRSLLRLVALAYSVWRPPTTFSPRSTTPAAFTLLFALCGMVMVPNVAQAQTAKAVEYWYAAWNMYFQTAFPEEISALDGGAFGGVWKRTGQSFAVWSQSMPGSTPMCRFFSIAFAPRSSHLYALPAECAYVKTNPADVAAWEFENIAFYIQPGDLHTGQCPGNTAPAAIYRLYNNGMGGAPNHRYTTDPIIVNQMIAFGWTPEGNGTPPVFACGPPASTLAIQTINPLPPAVAGQTYVPQLAATATGGEPPYHFQFDSFASGSPPLGMGIDLNGYLTGTPSATYTQSVTFSFSVCVGDLTSTIVCGPTSITVNPVAPGPVLNATMNWTITDSCNSGVEVDFKFFDDFDGLVWPSSSMEYYLYYNQQGSVNLSCVQGSPVCIGGQSGSYTFGNGLNDSTPYAGGACAACNGTGDPSTSAYAFTFTCGGTPPPPPPNGDWYYHWNCNGDPACLSTTPNGAPSGSIDEGPSYQACSPLLTYAQHFWNMPPATDSCTQTP